MNDSQFFIPQKRYFTIGEVAKLLDVAAHAIRYWEKEDALHDGEDVIKCIRRNNRRAYTRETVVTLMQLRDLILAKGYTVQGAMRRMKEGRAVEMGAQWVRYSSMLQTLRTRMVHIEKILAG